MLQIIKNGLVRVRTQFRGHIQNICSLFSVYPYTSTPQRIILSNFTYAMMLKYNFTDASRHICGYLQGHNTCRYCFVVNLLLIRRDLRYTCDAYITLSTGDLAINYSFYFTSSLQHLWMMPYCYRKPIFTLCPRETYPLYLC